MRTLGVLLLVLGLLAGRLTTEVKPVRAQQGCRVEFEGPFVYRLDGNYSIIRAIAINIQPWQDAPDGNVVSRVPNE